LYAKLNHLLTLRLEKGSKVPVVYVPRREQENGGVRTKMEKEASDTSKVDFIAGVGNRSYKHTKKVGRRMWRTREPSANAETAE